MTKPAAIRQISEAKHTTQLVFGDPGCGKTTYAGSAGKGTLIVRPPFDHTDVLIGTGCEEWVAHRWNDMDDILEWARHEGGSYERIWLDSISLWQDAGMDDIWQAVVALHPHRLKAYYDRGEYRINMGRLSEWVRYMIGCDLFDFGITAHPFWATFRENEGEGEEITKLMPWIQGKAMPQKICGMMHMVGYMTVHPSKKNKGGVYRKITWNGNENFYAKDGFGAFPKGYVMNPTLPEVMKQIEAVRAKKRTKTGSDRARTRRRK